VSLVARHLEAHGIPTVIIGSAKDIVEHCGVPRFVYSDFPLGNPCGHPWNKDMQQAIVGQALGLLETAEEPRTTIQAPFAWKPDPVWRARYNRVMPEDRERLMAIGDERRRKRGQVARGGAPG
jgi:D-proline reductase (dithiol) PrdB